MEDNAYWGCRRYRRFFTVVRMATLITLHIGAVKEPFCNSGFSESHLTDGYCWPTPSAEICASHMPSWKAKKLGKLVQEKVLLEL